MAIKTKDLNRASAEDLMEAGLTESQTLRLIERRDENGELDWEEVQSVPGFTQETVNELRDAGFTIECGSINKQDTELDLE